MKVVTVQMERSFRTFLCDAQEGNYKAGDVVAVETDDGVTIGKVVGDSLRRGENSFPTPRYKVLRGATEQDLQREQEEARKAEEALRICKEKIQHLDLPMKLLEVTFSSSGDKVTFFFTAENRVNFRELVKQLAAEFHMRVELRQVGARNEAQKIGGVGCCGRPICCASFLSRFDPVTIRMAKDQGLSLEPAKISGLCGRLLCCLSYEAETYADQLKKMPKHGSRVTTSYGQGKVVKLNVLEQSFVVEFEEGRRMTITPDDIVKKASEKES